MIMKRRLLILIISLSVVLCACGGAGLTADMAEPMMASGAANKTEMAMSDSAFEMDFSESEAVSGTSSLTQTENAQTSSRKLIRNVDLNVETKQFDTLINNIQDKIGEIGGYVERMDGYYGSTYSSYRSEKNATIVSRVPADRLDEFITDIGNRSNITYRSESVTDVTLDYVDIESHKKMLIEERDRLMEFLKSAESIEDIISIEDRLTEVRYQIDSLESQIRTYDNKIDYSTVTISIQEVIDYTVTPTESKSTWERIAEGFTNSLINIGIGLKEFFVWVIIHIPYILLWAVIIICIIFAVRKIRSKNPERAMKRRAKAEAKKAAKEAAKKDAGQKDEQ